MAQLTSDQTIKLNIIISNTFNLDPSVPRNHFTSPSRNKHDERGFVVFTEHLNRVKDGFQLEKASWFNAWLGYL